MQLILESPTKCRIYDPTSDQVGFLRNLFTYTNTSVQFQVNKFKKSASKYATPKGQAFYQAHLKDLQSKMNGNCLFEDEKSFWVHAGLAHQISATYDIPVLVQYTKPEPKLIAWNKPPKFELRYYQKEALKKLLDHVSVCGIEIATGCGKTSVITYLVKHFGLKTVVMAPTTNIANQLHDELVERFGKSKVGLFGDGKKDFKKQIVVSIGASLTRIKAKTEEWNEFQNTQVLIVDEAHTTGAKTLEDVCHNLLKNVPYRYFVSATQTRNDGLETVLDSIIGPIVYEYTLDQAVREGFLSKPNFKILPVQSNAFSLNHDPNELTRTHLFYNGQVNKKAAELANQYVDNKTPVLILIDEIEQFAHIYPHLKHLAQFAHGPLTKDNSGNIPPQFHKSDTSKLVQDFNQGKIPILIGTSCISMGTDIQPVGAIIYLQGGSSKIQVPQAVGRGTRGGFNGLVRNPWTEQLKTEFDFIDFDVINQPVLHAHTKKRIKLYKNLYDNVKVGE